MEKTIKVGDVIKFAYHDYDYSRNPIVVTEVDDNFVYGHAIVSGLLDSQLMKFPMFYTKRNCTKLTMKAFGVSSNLINNLLRKIYEDQLIERQYIFLKYTGLKRCLRTTKYDILKLYFRKQIVYVNYDSASFVKRSDGSLCVMLDGCRECGKK